LRNIVSRISSLEQVARFWQDCIAEFSRMREKDVVYLMLSVCTSDYFTNLYDSGKNPNINTIFDALMSLDVSKQDIETRGYYWGIIRNNLYNLGIYL